MRNKLVLGTIFAAAIVLSGCGNSSPGESVETIQEETMQSQEVEQPQSDISEEVENTDVTITTEPMVVDYTAAESNLYFTGDPREYACSSIIGLPMSVAHIDITYGLASFSYGDEFLDCYTRWVTDKTFELEVPDEEIKTTVTVTGDRPEQSTYMINDPREQVCLDFVDSPVMSFTMGNEVGFLTFYFENEMSCTATWRGPGLINVYIPEMELDTNVSVG